MSKILVDKLYNGDFISDDELKIILTDKSITEYITQKADEIRRKYYGDKVYIRGLIELSSYCKNDCLYCGIRRSNKDAKRYRLTKNDILKCCENGYELGFRTFVLQGGEDGFFTDELLCSIITEIKSAYSDCAVTLSLGERSEKSYKLLRNAGADRYLLRHETATDWHYSKLHPEEMKLSNRKECLYNLKKLGYQVGAGFMVGSPFQTLENIVADLRFLQELNPSMIGIGPFIPHKSTEFKDFPKGDLDLTLRVLSIVRLIFQKALIPATTALGTINPQGRELGLKAGCNVVMPNLSPVSVRKKYNLYDDKICTGEEAAECKMCLEKRIESVGYKICIAKGNSLI